MLSDASALGVVEVPHDGGLEVVAGEVDVGGEDGLDVGEHQVTVSVVLLAEEIVP